MQNIFIPVNSAEVTFFIEMLGLFLFLTLLLSDTVCVLEFSILGFKPNNELSGKIMGGSLGMRQTFNETMVVLHRNSFSKYFSLTFYPSVLIVARACDSVYLAAQNVLALNTEL